MPPTFQNSTGIGRNVSLTRGTNIFSFAGASTITGEVTTKEMSAQLLVCKVMQMLMLQTLQEPQTLILQQEAMQKLLY